MIYFTSDEHYYHRNSIKYCNRPFRTWGPHRIKEWFTGEISEASVLKMNKGLIANHNEVVRPGDVVYHLGDFSLWRRAPERVLHRLNGEHHLIAGNHDWCHPVHTKNTKKIQKMVDYYLDCGFKTVATEGEIEIAGQRVAMHHMPYVGDHGEERYREFRPKDEGRWLLHGHVHNVWKTRGRMINVGVDVWDYRPVSIDKIAEIIASSEDASSDPTRPL